MRVLKQGMSQAETHAEVHTPEASALVGEYGSRLCELEGCMAHKAQCDLRLRRYGGVQVEETV